MTPETSRQSGAARADCMPTPALDDLFVHLASIASDTQRDVADLFERLSAPEPGVRAGADSLIADILKLVAESLDVGMTFITRLDAATLRVERTYDRIGMGLHGAVATLCATACLTLLTSASRSLVVEDAFSDPQFAVPFAARDPRVGSFSGVPLYHSDGRCYGTLCTIHPEARSVPPGEIALLSLAGRMIVQEIEADALRKRERRLMHEIAASEERLRAVYTAISCGVAVVDPAGRVVEANDAAQEILGLDLDGLRGQLMAEVIGPTYRLDGSFLPVDERPLGQALRTRQPQRDVVMGITRLDGRRRWIQTDVIPVLDEGGGTQYLVLSFVDITERTQAEEALRQSHRELERSNGELEQFAYVASHDLQEPLRMVASYVQLLGRRYRGALDADADEFIAFAVEGVTRMQTLINDLLAYSRVGTRAKPLLPTPLAGVLAAAQANLAALVAESGATIAIAGSGAGGAGPDGAGAEVGTDGAGGGGGASGAGAEGGDGGAGAEGADGALPLVRGDAGQLTQLVQNLLANALKFRRAGVAPVVRVWAERHGAEWHLRVQDNGIGLDVAYAERIFLMFQRLHTREEYAGTGIGLAICKKIAERHGGRLWVESAPGAGATFTLALPALDAADALEATEAADTAA